MSVNRYADLLLHVGHEIECVAYGDDVNVAIECVDCGEVLLDFDQHDDKDGGPPIEWERGPFQAPEMARWVPGHGGFPGHLPEGRGLASDGKDE